MPLTIGIDARELLGAKTGVGRYLGELLLRWTARPDGASRRFLLYSPEPLQIRFDGPHAAVTERVLPGGRGTWWEQTTLRAAVNADRPDVFFAPSYTAPVGLRARFAVTIHDVSFTAHPEWFRWREGTRRRMLTRYAARAAARVFTVSEFSRAEIQRHYRVPPAKILVAPPGVVAPVRAASAREPLVLYAGSVFNRRRVPDLIAAFALVTRAVPAARLALVGDDRTWPPQNLGAVVAAHGLGDRVTITRYVPEQELSDLYARASAFAFLSEYEGFGLTPLEAMAAGVPPVVLDTPVAHEVYGDAARFAAPGDIAGTANALVELLTVPAARERLLRCAPAVLARYSWDRTADAMLSELERIAG